ncbi:hypothetical protein FLL45_12110 [Aliikangiella marina]|uniref:Uncharacterized protein n=1 Tax=Aliikangiella marina TaxID=1712262 RepID=A0A545T8S4_9GAMM|nr:hypothetical protein [Aliikangiella marina]TQV73611.1 hypothetical protein FLL45_12110 [Aliikangiella marina]
MVGFGSPSAKLKVYFQNRPPLEAYQQLEIVKPLGFGEIKFITEQTGNHWRKIFNCYAKFLFALDPSIAKSWQDYRDQTLLQKQSNEQLLFSSRDLTIQNSLHIVAGRTYFRSLKLDSSCQWLDEHFAIDVNRRLIVSPYFDYRQLSNSRILQLVSLVKELE